MNSSLLIFFILSLKGVAGVPGTLGKSGKLGVAVGYLTLCLNVRQKIALEFITDL